MSPLRQGVIQAVRKTHFEAATSQGFLRAIGWPRCRKLRAQVQSLLGWADSVGSERAEPEGCLSSGR